MDDDPVESDDSAIAEVIPLPDTAFSASGRSSSTRLIPDPIAGPSDDPIVGPEGDTPETDGLVAVPRLARHEIVLADDHRVGVAVCGQGLPVVLVHGFTAEGFLYAQTLSRLVSMGFKVIAIDMAGHGGTEGLPGNFSIGAEIEQRIASGEPFALPCAMVLTMAQGRVTRIDEYFDPAPASAL